MKVLLINPELKKYVQPKLMPLGLCYIAAVLEKDGIDVKIIDMNVQKIDLEDKLSWAPDIVGITATTPLVKEAWRIAKIIKKRENIPVVLGGPHPSALPEESLENGADIIVRNEGETTMLEFVKAIHTKDLSKVAGITYKKNGEIYNNPDRPLLTNAELDKLPFPAYHLLPDISLYSTPQPVITEKLISATIVTSRGCPYGCNYCFKGVFGRAWRAHSSEYIVKLWKFLVEKYKVQEMSVQDDVFNIDKQRVMEICKGLLKEGIKIRWTTAQGLRADNVDREMLMRMKEAGFFRTGFGIESGVEDVANAIGKHLSFDKVKEAFYLCKELDIEAIGYFMIGNTYENEKTMSETINFAIKLDPDIAHFTTPLPFPGTQLYDLIKEKGRFLIDDWDLYGYTRGICYFELGEVKKEVVERMWKKAYRRFYLRPKVIFRLLLKKGGLKRIPKIIQASFMYLGFKKNG